MADTTRTTLNASGIIVPGSDGPQTETAATTSKRLHQVAFGRTARLKLVRWFNLGASDVRINIGDTADGTTAGAFTQRIASIDAIAGRGDMLTEEQLEQYEFSTGNIFFQLSAAVAAGVQVMIQVEEV